MLPADTVAIYGHRPKRRATMAKLFTKLPPDSLMNIYLNGKAFHVADAMTLTELLLEMDYSGKRIAVEINQEIIPRSEHNTHRLKNDDRVEVVHAIGGG